MGDNNQEYQYSAYDAAIMDQAYRMLDNLGQGGKGSMQDFNAPSVAGILNSQPNWQPPVTAFSPTYMESGKAEPIDMTKPAHLAYPGTQSVTPPPSVPSGQPAQPAPEPQRYDIGRYGQLPIPPPPTTAGPIQPFAVRPEESIYNQVANMFSGFRPPPALQHNLGWHPYDFRPFADNPFQGNTLTPQPMTGEADPNFLYNVPGLAPNRLFDPRTGQLFHVANQDGVPTYTASNVNVYTDTPPAMRARATLMADLANRGLMKPTPGQVEPSGMRFRRADWVGEKRREQMGIVPPGEDATFQQRLQYDLTNELTTPWGLRDENKRSRAIAANLAMSYLSMLAAPALGPMLGPTLGAATPAVIGAGTAATNFALQQALGLDPSWESLLASLAVAGLSAGGQYLGQGAGLPPALTSGVTSAAGSAAGQAIATGDVDPVQVLMSGGQGAIRGGLRDPNMNPFA